jgi:hypothetical protein
VSVAPSGGSDPAQIRVLLEDAEGYAVLEREGRRVGAFIEVDQSPRGDRIAIRHDGVLLWRRRLLPISAVASVVPERRAVMLNVDRTELDNEPPPGTVAAEEGAGTPRHLQERIASYVSAGESAPERPEPEPARADTHDGEGHLVFVSTTHGYELAELTGPPPRPGQQIEVPEHPGSFVVTKVGPSPLPDDSRPCAYLAPAE